jgi:hypothetical protein
MNGLAEGTGGFLVHSANDLLAGLDRILDESRRGWPGQLLRRIVT